MTVDLHNDISHTMYAIVFPHGSFTLPETDSSMDSDSDSCPVQK